MDAIEFQNMQEAILWVYLPFAHWLVTLLLGFGVLSGVFSLWMATLRWMTARR
jgi:hypothetical protein